MKIALVTETYPPDVNGAAMTLRRLAGGLTGRGHEVMVIRPRPGDETQSQVAPLLDGERLHHVKGMPIPCYPEMRFGFPAGRHLRGLWKGERPDLVHVATEGPLGRSAVRTAVRLGLPLTTSFHTNFHTYAGHYGCGLLRKLSLGWLRMVHREASRTFVPSETVRAELSAAGFENLVVIGRGVDTELYSPDRRSASLRRSWGAEGDAPVALYVGRVATEKNMNLTVRAFETIRTQEPATRCVIVGHGPLHARLQKAHPDYHFAGLRLGESLAAHYASGDVFVFASETETFGNVVTEAMASGLLVLAYDYAAARLHIEPEKSGITVPRGDADAFLASARQLARTRATWDAMRASARATAQSISWSSVVDRFERHLRAVAGRGAPPARGCVAAGMRSPHASEELSTPARGGARAPAAFDPRGRERRESPLPTRGA